MTIRIDKTINTFVTADTAQECGLFGQKSTAKNLQRIDTMQRLVSGRLEIAASGTEAIPFGDVGSVKYVELVADKGFDVVFNGGVDVIAFRPADTASDRTVTMSMDAELTAVAVTNIDAAAVLTGTFVVYGDPTP